jgi:glycosyltransferase involved in cell wall biosynthesis
MILGGAQENTLLTCRGQVLQGHDVLLITGPTSGPEGALLKQTAEWNIPVQEIASLTRPLAPIKDWRAYGQLKTCLRDFQPQVVHTHSSKAGVIGRYAATSLKIPAIVHTIHGLPFHPFQNPLLRWIYIKAETLAARHCHKILSVASAMSQQAISAGVAPPEKFVTVYSGMNVDPFVNAGENRSAARKELGFSDQDFVIVKLARLFELKGHKQLLAAAPEIARRHPHVKFLLVGDGLLRSSLEAEVREKGLEDNFVFAGLIDPEEVPKHLAAANLLVHTSLREGLPRALPQALLTGTPVVAVDLDGSPEVIQHQKTGLLVPADEPAALVAAVCRMIEEPEFAARTAQAGHQLVLKTFPTEIMVKSILDIYSQILNSKKQQAER